LEFRVPYPYRTSPLAVHISRHLCHSSHRCTHRLPISHPSSHSTWHRVLRKIRTIRASDFGFSRDRPAFHLCPCPFISYCTSACFAEEPTAKCSDCRWLDKSQDTYLICFQRDFLLSATHTVFMNNATPLSQSWSEAGTSQYTSCRHTNSWSSLSPKTLGGHLRAQNDHRKASLEGFHFWPVEVGRRFERNIIRWIMPQAVNGFKNKAKQEQEEQMKRDLLAITCSSWSIAVSHIPP
jgi:hypothetical protein